MPANSSEDVQRSARLDVAKRPREDREVGARRDIAVRPDPHVARTRGAAARATGVGPDILHGPFIPFSRTVLMKCGAHFAFTSMRRSGLLLDPVERGEDLVVLRGRDVRHELPAAGRHQEVEVPDLRGEAIVREVGDRFELAEIVRAHGRLHDEGEPGPVEVPAPSTVFRQAPRTFLKRS